MARGVWAASFWLLSSADPGSIQLSAPDRPWKLKLQTKTAVGLLLWALDAFLLWAFLLH